MGLDYSVDLQTICLSPTRQFDLGVCQVWIRNGFPHFVLCFPRPNRGDGLQKGTCESELLQGAEYSLHGTGFHLRQCWSVNEEKYHGIYNGVESKDS